VVQRPDQPRLSTTDFLQLGTSYNLHRFSVTGDVFLIDRSHEQVYIPDDGSFEFKGPSRSYGWELKTSAQLTHHVSFTGGLTQVSNAFYRGSAPREYVDSAPHSVGNAGLTLAGWRGTFGSVRYRHISGYRLDGLDPSIHASGLDVVDVSMSKAIRHGVEFNASVDNANDKRYYETQNYLESRAAPDAPVVARIHGTPGYPVGFTVGMTFRFGEK
jgi:outer membrane receptor protein involved in Fe transport